MRKRDGSGAVAPTHNPTKNYTFAQKFAQFTSMRNTMRNRNGNDSHNIIKNATIPSLRNTVCKHNLQPKTMTNNHNQSHKCSISSSDTELLSY